MKLSAISKGNSARIHRLPEGVLRSQFIRLGLMEGAVVECIERLPGGTLVLQHGRQEVALSAELADAILIALP